MTGRLKGLLLSARWGVWLLAVIAAGLLWPSPALASEGYNQPAYACDVSSTVSAPTTVSATDSVHEAVSSPADSLRSIYDCPHSSYATNTAEEAAIHSRYADGTPVLEGQQPPRLGTATPDPVATGPHSQLRWDPINGRIYQAREFDVFGNPVRDIDFTGPTFPNGTLRPNHWIPEQHVWFVNDPVVGPKSGWVRGPGQPL